MHARFAASHLEFSPRPWGEILLEGPSQTRIAMRERRLNFRFSRRCDPNGRHSFSAGVPTLAAGGKGGSRQLSVPLRGRWSFARFLSGSGIGIRRIRVTALRTQTSKRGAAYQQDTIDGAMGPN